MVNMNSFQSLFESNPSENQPMPSPFGYNYQPYHDINRFPQSNPSYEQGAKSHTIGPQLPSRQNTSVAYSNHTDSSGYEPHQ